MCLAELEIELKSSRKTALITGAGISRHMGVPLGNQLLMLFSDSNQAVIKEIGLESKWHQAVDNKEQELIYVSSFVEQYQARIALQRNFIEWLLKNPDKGIQNISGASSDIHAAFVISWINRIFTHLITTNWDFLLEYHIDKLTNLEVSPEEFRSPFDPAEYIFSSGKKTAIEAENIYSLNPRESDGSFDDFFMEARWDIMSSNSDLERREEWTRPIWKIHGSPFFLACPECGGFSRWKWVKELTIGDPCPQHPENILQPEIILWGQGLDTVAGKIWKVLATQLQETQLLVVCGLSGSGSDKYIRDVVEAHPNAWVVDPYIGEWNQDKVHYVNASAAEFADLLIENFLA